MFLKFILSGQLRKLKYLVTSRSQSITKSKYSFKKARSMTQVSAMFKLNPLANTFLPATKLLPLLDASTATRCTSTNVSDQVLHTLCMHYSCDTVNAYKYTIQPNKPRQSWPIPCYITTLNMLYRTNTYIDKETHMMIVFVWCFNTWRTYVVSCWSSKRTDTFNGSSTVVDDCFDWFV